MIVSLLLYHADDLHARALANENMVLGVLDQMTPAALREFFFSVLSNYYLETAGAS
jgi:hypothetical protein